MRSQSPFQQQYKVLVFSYIFKPVSVVGFMKKPKHVARFGQ
jgi:hypothetical protein